MSEDESSDDEVISIKSEDEEFHGPKIESQTPSPTRSQAPRRAKTERKASWVELSSTEEDDSEDEVMDNTDKGDDDGKESGQQGEDQEVREEQSGPDAQLVSYDTGIMVID
ncbi:hypothetical protein M409DRAFT_21233 [Zasmidium cellare ATCC 36951]|uniref:Uncharacterized protein n=1 Tax=Zasmidium cellare ATCC 36951 TaxID=1080233 RepID=A0A6A6CMW5_ZASCE|nr:uncharacterized protein M409DRAFT_21233 [Zasmidium cellare ATCC 36951]KAF2168484.1 hypothetical protein M409DRAFT_21233 [Zasmidium cellare ATCC 36951]